MKKIISAILGMGINAVIYVIAILVLFRVGTWAYDFSYEVFGEPVVSEYSDQEVHIEIASGDGSKTIAAKLKDNGVISNEWAFIIKARLSNANLMPGIYIVRPNMSADDMIAIMSDSANSLVQQPTADDLARDMEDTETEETGEVTGETDEGEDML